MRGRHSVNGVALFPIPEHPHPTSASVLPAGHCRLCHDMEVGVGPPSCDSCGWILHHWVFRPCCGTYSYVGGRKRSWGDKEEFHGFRGVRCLLCGQHHWAAVGEESVESEALPRVVDWSYHLVRSSCSFNLLMCVRGNLADNCLVIALR